MIVAVPRPSGVSSPVRQRQTCFCGLLRSATTASRRARSAAFTVTMIPLRIPETRTPASPWESSKGLNCQVGSTSLAASLEFGVTLAGWPCYCTAWRGVGGRSIVASPCVGCGNQHSAFLARDRGYAWEECRACAFVRIAAAFTLAETAGGKDDAAMGRAYIAVCR